MGKNRALRLRGLARRCVTALGLSLCIFAFVVNGRCSAQVAASVKLLPPITAVAFSPDGSKLAVGTYGQVVVFDVATWQQAAVFRKVADAVRALAFSPDGKMLAVGSGLPSRSGKVILWELMSASPPVELPGQQDTVESLAFRADGRGLLVGADDNKVRLFGELPSSSGQTLDEHNGRVLACAYSPKMANIFVTGALDKIVKVWDAKLNRTVINFDQSQAGICGLVFLPSGNQFVGAGLDGRLHWWQINYDEKKQNYSGNRYRQMEVDPAGLLALAISGDGKRIIVGGEGDSATVRDAGSGRELHKFKDPTQPTYAVALNTDGKIAAAGGREGVVRIWDVEKGQLLQTITPPELPKPAPVKPAVKPAAPHVKTRRS